MSKTKIVVVINQKGGVGKSTVAFHLAHGALKNKKSRVLCLDMDAQGNLSQYLTGDLDIVKETEGGVGLFLEGKPIIPTKTTHPQIDLLHGHEELDRYDNDDEVQTRGYNPIMQETLRGLGYDVVIIDTPPAIGFRHLAPLCWADIALIPMLPVMTAISGFQNVVAAIDTHIKPMNPGLKWFGMMNLANMRVKSHKEKDAWVRRSYGARILATMATRSGVLDAMEQEPAQPVWLRAGTPKALREEWLSFCHDVISK